MTAVGLGGREFGNTVVEISNGIDEGLHPGAQVYVSRHGKTFADFALGIARPGFPMTPDSRTCWLSAGKPLTAALCLQLIEQEKFSLETPLGDLLPEWRDQVDVCNAAAGEVKASDNSDWERIRVRHLLTHTSGLPERDTGWPMRTWNETIATIVHDAAEARRDGLTVAPGERGAYDRGAAWFLLGELIRRIAGQDFATILREQLLFPAGMLETSNGFSHTDNGDHGSSTNSQSDPWADLATRTVGMREQQWLGWNGAPHLTRSAPGGNTRGPARDLGRFYEILLGILTDGNDSLRESRVLSQQSVSQMTSRHRVGMRDETFRHVIDFGLGVIVNSARYGRETVPYGFGSRATEAAFGHGGSQSSIAFADPARNLVIVVITNGMPGEPKHQARMRRILAAIEADVERL